MEEYTIIQNGRVYTPTQVIEDGVVVFNGNGILAVCHRDNVPDYLQSPTHVIDAGGNLVCPGFIDQHVHGGGGADTMDQSYEAICTIAQAHAAFGVTAFCPTTMAAPDDEMEKALAAVAMAVKKGTGGAKVLGSHIEGPCISVEARGAHFDEYVRHTPPTIERLYRYYNVAQGTIKIWTIAPELPRAIDFIRAASKLGIKISIGHTRASYNEVHNAIEAGATGATHLYNAMAGFHYRDAGATMAILHSQGRIIAEIIADGAHVHPAAIYTAIRTLGPENVLLVTDCMRPAGLPSMTSFELPGITAFVKEGQVLTAEGKLCGSLLTMNHAVQNVNAVLGQPLAEAITLATLNPARSLAIANRKGSLEIGKDADIVICDHFLQVRRTIVEGTTIYATN
jgi:N-acetylglucosamine-6-phosphate deacetylase